MKKILIFISALICVVSLSVSCQKQDDCRGYSFSKHFTTQHRDTLFVDMVTLIGKKPKTADFITRHETRHRKYYINLSGQFEMTHFHITNDDTAYFYMIRPARSVKGTTRGVGGKFTLNEQGKPDYFEEVFNTPVKDREELLKTGCTLFLEMLLTGNVNAYLWNKDIIEWPDERLKYDTEKQEWRYDVVN